MKTVHYQIRVTGNVPAGILEQIQGVRAIPCPLETVLRGTVDDQAELNSVINHVHGLGLELTEIRRLTPEHPHTPPKPSADTADKTPSRPNSP